MTEETYDDNMVKIMNLFLSENTENSVSENEISLENNIKNNKNIVLVIDDIGYNLMQLKPFLNFPGPMTFAVLPDLPYTQEAIILIKNAGKEIILHQPMEAEGIADEGFGAIYSKMSESDIIQILEKNIDQIPYIVGISNHMGSLATRDQLIVETVLDTASSYGLYFLDSLTIRDSLVGPAAAQKRMEIWERDVFLDNKPDRESIEKKMEEGKQIASTNGRAILIGHVWSSELAQTLMDIYPALIEEGFSLSTISRIMMEEANANTGD